MITIRQMETTDIPAVTTLHRISLAQTFSSKMGPTYLRLLYRCLLGQSKLHIAFVAEERGTIVGATVATEDFTKTQSLLAKRLFWLNSPLIFWSMVKGRLGFAELINYIRFEIILRSRFFKPRPTILALFVDTRFRRHGVAKNLVMTVMKKFMRQGHGRLYVDTLKSNEAAQQFYRAMGFTVEEGVFDSVMLARRL